MNMKTIAVIAFLGVLTLLTAFILLKKHVFDDCNSIKLYEARYGVGFNSVRIANGLVPVEAGWSLYWIDESREYLWLPPTGNPMLLFNKTFNVNSAGEILWEMDLFFNKKDNETTLSALDVVLAIKYDFIHQVLECSISDGGRGRILSHDETKKILNEWRNTAPAMKKTGVESLPSDSARRVGQASLRADPPSPAAGLLMQTLPDTGVSNNANYVADSPRLDFEVDFAAAGTYTVYVRGRAKPAPDDGAAVLQI